MWVCWYGNDLNKQESFPSGKNYFAFLSFSFFLLLYLTNVGILFPARCGDAEQWKGRKGMRFHCPYLSSVYVAYTKTQAEAVRREAGCRGVAMEGCPAPWPRPHRVAGEQGQTGRGEGLCTGLAGEQWWWWWGAPVQPGRRWMTLRAPPFCWEALRTFLISVLFLH